ncbi:5-methylthioadenosine/S-adenosylhomocysteine deaminase [Podospora aff. communis PSN243]|uniref:5-methylthioadenosine/S-adenosylhomocysteine deaminase n=1 Tax=Podospora aff. communis PSN243 TaxID=3040156 RepID=A0AAV9GT57_9PEZI|nr:5-methylthioadenosine/S-adenosylhomocysteine deaminase [Podospora aff. communis PSN243]
MRLFSTLVAAPGLAAASSILFQGGTIIAFDNATESLRVIRGGSVLVTDDRITKVSESAISVSKGTEVVDITGKILAPGQINTHFHGWQTAFKTLGSNTSLVEYFNRYGEYAAADLFSAEDVYLSQLAGVLESVNGGVTTILDHAHHTWSNDTSEAGWKASIDSGARVFWGYTFHNITTREPNFLVDEQLANFRALASNPKYKGHPAEISIAYDGFANGNVAEIRAIMDLAQELDIPVITSHHVEGPWPLPNNPELLLSLGLLNSTIPFVLSHASFITPRGMELLREHNHYISITPESEFHYGHTHPTSHLIQDQATIGVDTHFTFSSDILTQTRMWMQTARRTLYAEVLNRSEIPVNNPMSVNQAFLMATRNGGLSLRRNDLGIIAEGAKADLVLWDATSSPSLLGWNDPVAAILLHASVGDIEAVLVDGKWLKKKGKLVMKGYYKEFKEKFLASAERIQNRLVATLAVVPAVGEEWINGLLIGQATEVDAKRGAGTGYGTTFWLRMGRRVES